MRIRTFTVRLRKQKVHTARGELTIRSRRAGGERSTASPRPSYWSQDVQGDPVVPPQRTPAPIRTGSSTWTRVSPSSVSRTVYIRWLLQTRATLVSYVPEAMRRACPRSINSILVSKVRRNHSVLGCNGNPGRQSGSGRQA